MNISFFNINILGRIRPRQESKPVKIVHNRVSSPIKHLFETLVCIPMRSSHPQQKFLPFFHSHSSLVELTVSFSMFFPIFLGNVLSCDKLCQCASILCHSLNTFLKKPWNYVKCNG